MNDEDARALAAIEAGMVAIRRRQTRRALARSGPAGIDPAVFDVVDAVEAAESAPEAPKAPKKPDTPKARDAPEAPETPEAPEAPGASPVREGAATVMSIAAALDVAQPRASKLVAAAVEAGLIRREADQGDGRRALLVRTVAGRELSERVHQARRARFAAATANWTAAERTAFSLLLTRFVDGLTETAAERH